MRWTRCADRWTTIWNQTRRLGQKTEATHLKGSRWLLLRNAQDLTANEAAKLAMVAKLNGPPGRLGVRRVAPPQAPSPTRLAACSTLGLPSCPRTTVAASQTRTLTRGVDHEHARCTRIPDGARRKTSCP